MASSSLTHLLRHRHQLAGLIFAVVFLGMGLEDAGGGLWAFHLQQANPEVQQTNALGPERKPMNPERERQAKANSPAQAPSALPLLKPLWAFPSFTEKQTEQLVGQAIQANEAQNRPTMPEKGPTSLTETWKVAPPVIQDSKVVFTDPDSEFIYCLNLRDGKRLWQAERKDDLYLAGVHRDRVVLVGRSTCRALRLADGHSLWQIETGLPSGYGMIRGNIFYLPLKAAITTRQPEVCALDLDAGRIMAHTRSGARADGSMEVPGNLRDADGTVISQTVTAIMAYPRLAEVLARIDVVLKKNPNDPTALMERGDLRCLSGEPAAAVEDFRAALANRPPPAILRRLKLQLFDALTELGKRDPKALEKYLDEYEKLGKEVLEPRMP